MGLGLRLKKRLEHLPTKMYQKQKKDDSKEKKRIIQMLDFISKTLTALGKPMIS
jgi:hypothetical protein